MRAYFLVEEFPDALLEPRLLGLGVSEAGGRETGVWRGGTRWVGPFWRGVEESG